MRILSSPRRAALHTLLAYIRSEYRKRGYEEVITPNVFNVDLWKQSGHWQHYQENMFSFTDGEKGANGDPNVFALKPMNCPSHCVMFNHRTRSYRELPMRYADFGVLHRNELSGALSGLTRVRRFQQDDAHIFCRQDQMQQEVLGALDFMKSVYTTFGMPFKLERSTRPKKACGLETPEGVALWDAAEKALADALDTFVGAGNWKDNPGDGAFYGPKIDIKVYDAMKRVHQCATIQLDFQLPIRFNLRYKSASEDKDFERPVIVHRAMLGSLERMTAVLTEHFGAKWPFWLSPRQACVVPIHAEQNDYAWKVRNHLHDRGFYVDVSDSTKTLNKKILLAQKAQYNFILVVGGQEQEGNSVNIRSRDNKRLGVKTLEECTAMFQQLTDDRVNDSESMAASK